MPVISTKMACGDGRWVVSGAGRLLAGVAQADLGADLVKGGHDGDGLRRGQDVARDAARADQALGLVRLELHAAALDGRAELLGQRAVGVVDAQPGRLVPDAVELDA